MMCVQLWTAWLEEAWLSLWAPQRLKRGGSVPASISSRRSFRQVGEKEEEVGTCQAIRIFRLATRIAVRSKRLNQRLMLKRILRFKVLLKQGCELLTLRYRVPRNPTANG